MVNSEVRHCPNCGHLASATARHCEDCGAALDGTPTLIDVTTTGSGGVTGSRLDTHDGNIADSSSRRDPSTVQIDDGPFFRSYRFGDARDGGFRGNVILARSGGRTCLIALLVSIASFVMLCLLLSWLVGQLF